MPQPAAPDHDQRLKVLLKEFFEAFFLCFFPTWAARFEFLVWEQRIVRFEYAYVGLPALDGEQYATGENLLGVALSTLMRIPADRRVELCAEELKRIARSGENDYRQYLLGECLETYAELDEAQRERLKVLLPTEQYPEVQSLMKTTYERGYEHGTEHGIHQGELRAALLLLEAKFGPLSPEVKQKVEALSPEALAQLLLDLLEAQSLEELRLEDGSQAENTL
jgi:hypothetical protein